MDWMFLIDVLVIAGGIYVIYACVRMKQTHKICDKIFLSSDLQARKCKDEAAYCEQVWLKGLICGMIVTVISILSVAGYYITAFSFFSTWGFVGILAVYVWFLTFAGKANKQFYN